MAKDVKFNIRLNIDGKEHIVSTTTSVKDLQNAVNAARSSSDEFTQSMIDWTNIRSAVDGLQSSFQSIYAAMSDLAGAYATQQEAETKLAVVMRERMGATSDDINSIKALASVQQQLGVIGDEVQLAGAQQVATFLTEKQSIDTLLPAMNNLLAQQRGLNATSSDAVNIGNLMGKAMQGQVAALTRVGITFNAVQKEVMKLGTEQERAAMLAEIITQNVGNMNAELAKTSAGQLKQLNNALGDMREQMGAIAQTAMPYLTMASQATTAALGAGKLYASLRGVITALGITKASILAVPGPLKTMAVALAMNGVNAKVAAISVRALSLALKGMMLATGAGAALAALSVVMEKLTSTASSASSELENNGRATQALADAKDEFTRRSGEVKASLDMEVTKLKQLMKAHGDTSASIIRLNSEYGGIFGRHKTAADWYDVLIKKSKAYAMQLGYEAQAKVLASQIAQKQIELDTNNDARKQLWKDGKARVDKFRTVGSSSTGYAQTVGYKDDSDEYKKLKENGKNLVRDIKTLQAQFNKAVNGAQQYANQISAPSATPATPRAPAVAPKAATSLAKTQNLAGEAPSGIIGQLEAKLKILREDLAKATDEAAITTINKQIEGTDKELDRLRDLGKKAAEEFNAGAKENTKPLELKAEATQLTDIENNIQFYQDQLKTADINTASSINQEIKLWQDKANAIREAGTAIQEQVSEQEALISSWRNIEGVVGSIEGLTEALEGNKNAWSAICAVIDSAIGISQGIQGIVEVTKMLGLVSKGAATAKTAEAIAIGASTTATVVDTAATETAASTGLPVIATNKALTASYMELAAAEYMAAHASIPFAGFAIGAGFATAAKALVTAIGLTPFADGGIVSGPTAALIGEYSGASSNPEVVAPLDKLRSLIETDGDKFTGRVTFEIDGRKLVGILDKERNIRKRS